MSGKRSIQEIDLLVLNSIKDPFCIIDSGLRILRANHSLARIFHRSIQDIEGRTCYKALWRRAEPCRACPVQRVLDHGRPVTMTRRVRLPDGSKRWGERRIYPVLDENQNIIAVSIIIIDVTDIRNELGKYQKLLDNAIMTGFSEKGRDDRRSTSGPNDHYRLSSRETDVLRLMTIGCTNIDISSFLSISPHTVKSHVTHIFNKLGVNDRTQAAVLAVRQNLI